MLADFTARDLPKVSTSGTGVAVAVPSLLVSSLALMASAKL